MGLITGLIYVATGQFTLVLLVTFGLACIAAELIRKITGYNSFKGNLLGYAFFSLGMSQFFNIDSDSELAFGLENNGIAPDIIRRQVDKTVRDLHIEHLLHRDIFSMSGGEKQTLAFASVYAMNPEIYVLDEPSANLDRASTLICKTAF